MKNQTFEESTTVIEHAIISMAESLHISELDLVAALKSGMQSMLLLDEHNTPLIEEVESCITALSTGEPIAKSPDDLIYEQELKHIYMMRRYKGARLARLNASMEQYRNHENQ